MLINLAGVASGPTGGTKEQLALGTEVLIFSSQGVSVTHVNFLKSRSECDTWLSSRSLLVTVPCASVILQTE